jgi:hypothetical protein
MSPGHFTTMATLICGPAGLLVRYEWSGDCFRWNFYRGAAKMALDKLIEKAGPERVRSVLASAQFYP